jgi:hypothetical protein
LFISLGAILAMLASTLSLIAPVHSVGGAGQSASMAPSRAVTQLPMSPTIGAAISTLLSISFGSMSIWMNFFGPAPHCLPLPWLSSQLRRAPIIITTSASCSTSERAAPADNG